MFPYLAELLAAPLYPLLSWQGKRVRANTPRLPEAAGATSGTSAYIPQRIHVVPTFRLLSIGESPVAGVGVETQEQAITAKFAELLAQDLKTDVSWQAVGKNGADLNSAIHDLLPLLPEQAPYIDLVLIAFGVNDTTSFRQDLRYANELTQLLDAIHTRLRPSLVMLSGVPPVHAFPALPQPLRTVLGCKAKALDLVSKKIAAKREGVLYVSMELDTKDQSLMALDGYHPSAKGVQAWAQQLLCAFQNNLSKIAGN